MALALVKTSMPPFKLKKTPKACKYKLINVLKAYNADKQANNISKEARHMCKFYDSMNTRYHLNGAVVKQISTSTSDMGSAQDITIQVKIK